MNRALVAAMALALAALLPSGAHAQTRTHAISLVGTPALPADFTHFPHVNPDAPKGGEAVLGAIGTFDSFNPFILRGTAAAASSAIYDTLMRNNPDEASTSYAHLAESVEIAADRRSVAFELRPEAKFHDGQPITAEDVAWTFNTLRAQGRPNYRQYYADIDRVDVQSPRRVVFHFKTDANRELPSIVGQLVVLPKHWWASRDFTKPITEPPLGSSAWRLDKFELGRTVSLARNPDWWGKDRPTARGMDNFDRRRVEYFRDSTVLLEAFKAGQIDFRQENIAKEWATSYDFPAVRRNLVKRDELRHRLPTGMQGFVFNTRREVFKDIRVRQAIAGMFDFEWANANLFYGSYTRTNSYFSNSDLAAEGLPSPAELALLNPLRAQLPDSIFTKPFQLPVTDGSGNNREQARIALALLKSAGWEVKDRKLVNAQGKQMTFEILLDQPTWERIALPYVQWLGRLGIEARVRTVDPAQSQRLQDSFDYDMVVNVFGQSESPGNEQYGYWSCESAKHEGGDNLAGICDPAIEALLPKVVNAVDRESLIAASRALDRVLLSGWYVVPHWHIRTVRVAYWDKFGRPDKPVRTGLDFSSWWIDPARAAATEAARRAGN